MRTISLEELLEAGCHFGHQVTRQNPKSRDFVFEARDNIHIIDLEKTKEGLETAAAFIQSIAAKGGNLLIVATKRQAKNILDEEVKRIVADLDKTKPSDVGIFTVTNRWIGGTLTNFPEVLKNYKKLKDITAMLGNEEEKAKYTKKEIGQFEKGREKLESFYGGVSDMTKIPDALFIIDTHLETLAVSETRKMHVPSVGIVDTNADPTFITYPIPSNDDAVGALKIVIGYVLDAWREGKAQKGTKETEESKGTDTKIQSDKDTKRERKSAKKKKASAEQNSEEKLLEAPHDMQLEAPTEQATAVKAKRGRKPKAK